MSEIKNCDICGSSIADSPLYCEKCIARMEKLALSPDEYRKYLELDETLGRHHGFFHDS